MSKPINILLQTTIEPTENDWHIGRFSMLREYLARWSDRWQPALQRHGTGSRHGRRAGPGSLHTRPLGVRRAMAVRGRYRRRSQRRRSCRNSALPRSRRRTDDHARSHGPRLFHLRAGPGRRRSYLSHAQRGPTRSLLPTTATPVHLSGRTSTRARTAISSGSRQRCRCIRSCATSPKGVMYLPAHPHEGAVAAPRRIRCESDRDREEPGQRQAIQYRRGFRASADRRAGDRRVHLPSFRRLQLGFASRQSRFRHRDTRSSSWSTRRARWPRFIATCATWRVARCRSINPFPQRPTGMSMKLSLNHSMVRGSPASAMDSSLTSLPVP